MNVLGVNKDSFINRLKECADTLSLNDVVYVFSEEYKDNNTAKISVVDSDPYHIVKECSFC